MHNSKLLALFSSLSEKELKDFEKFLLFQTENSSYAAQLFYIIKNAAPDFSNKALAKEQVFNKIYAKETFKDVKVRELMSVLRKHLDNFLIYLEHNKDDYYNNLALLKQYRKRKLDALFAQQMKNIQSLQEEDPFINIERYKREYLLADEKNNFFEQQQIITHDEAIGQKNESFDKYYFSAKLRTLCEIINREKILNATYSKSIEDEIIQVISQNKSLNFDTPAVHCYFEIFHLLKSGNNLEQFSKTLNTLNRYQKSFTDSELKSMYAYLLNYCVQEVNKGNAEFTEKLFELQKLLLQNKILLENGALSHISYRNIVTIAIKLKEYAWAEKFIEDYKSHITDQHKENAYNLSKSNLLYAKNDFSETIFLLNQIEFTDVYYACTAKFTLLKAYYALKEFETLDYFVSSFQLYLKRNKEISINFKKSSENFLKHFKKVILIEKQLDYKEKEKIEKKIRDLIQHIHEEKTMANKAWLIEEIEKIKI